MEKVTSKDGTEIAFDKTGKGPAVILVGGALQHRADHLFSWLVPALADHFTVISYDRRGRRDSGDTLPYTTGREIEDLESLISRVGEPVSLFGMSSGGALALQTAGRRTDIRKVALYEPPFVGGDPDYAKNLKQLLRANRHSDAVKLFLKVIGMPRFLVGVLRLTPMWAQLKRLAPTLEYDAAMMGDGSVPPTFASMTTPTLILTGISESMRKAADSLVSTLPHARHQVLEGQTHNVKPGILAAALTDFFKEWR